MATHAAYFKNPIQVEIKNGATTVGFDSHDKARQYALNEARRQTGRSRVLAFVPEEDTQWHPDTEIEVIHSNRIAAVSSAMAHSDVRLAAILVVPDERDLKYKGFLRKVRELSSAEGALMIWDESLAQLKTEEGFFSIAPDIVCTWRRDNG